MRKLAVVTAGRSDYGIYIPLLRKIITDPELELYLLVTGIHLDPEYGSTYQLIETDGFRIFSKIPMHPESDSPYSIADAIGRGIQGFAGLFETFTPDVLIVLGDRFEMYAAVCAALPFKIPVAHIHGGECTYGAIDDALRHSMTKLSHLHFVSTAQYAARVHQMGEDQWRITVSGAPSLDNLKQIDLLDKKALEDRLGFSLPPGLLLCTFHPVTLEYQDTAYHIAELLAALHASGHPVLFTLPNNDTAGKTILIAIKEYVQTHGHAYLVQNCGTQVYFSLMAYCQAMIGNSSSGIIEAASFEMPVVNIGTRQEGRFQACNVVNTGYSRAEILKGIAQVTIPGIKATFQCLVNPYGDGNAAQRILSILKKVPLDQNLIMKKFVDIS